MLSFVYRKAESFYAVKGIILQNYFYHCIFRSFSVGKLIRITPVKIVQ